ncbi:hypothetical protein VTL71DRAFT_1222 [Oculimacula yallundae]|uniref:Aminoglycoside phosphotransferase domain-containing protein n=1 Tax=Oculimacula yallundae TaxID=86028 RepID=A0ABR4CA31_9HELO
MESERDRALIIIHNADLAHPGLPLIETFLNDAVDPDQAASFWLKTYTDEERDTDFERFFKDWKDLVTLFSVEDPSSSNPSPTLKKKVAQRDNYRCCLTGEQGRLWEICDVFPIVPPTAFCIRDQRLIDLLGAFTTPCYRGLLKIQTLENHTRNLWTLSQDAAIAFSRGAIRLERLEDTKYEIFSNSIGGKAPAICTLARFFDWKCDLVDHSDSGIESPAPELLDIRSRFSRALMWTDIATKIHNRSRPSRGQNRDTSYFIPTLSTVFLSMWLKFPEFVRFQTYRILRATGSYLYGSTKGGVQRLPFGMYLKHGPEYHANRHIGEFNALEIVRSQTRIPVPRPIDHLLSRTESFLVTSRLEGEPAGLALDKCSDEEMSQIGQDLRSWIAELHTIEVERDPKYAITNATGGPCLDYRIGGDPVGPFSSEKEFSDSLRLGILPGLVHRTDHQIVFTHADLNLRNIMVKDGKLSGIVDWENAGFFPEYWEYTKCYFGASLIKRWLKVVDGVFDNKYTAELGIERQYWEYNSL